MVAGTHTRLINMFMGLCADTGHWPNVLAKLGYKVQLIEQSVSMQSAEKVVPDVVSVSNKRVHAIVAECKGGNSIDPKQDGRYRQLTPGDLLHHVTVHDRNRFGHTVCYVDTSNNHDSLKRDTKFPFITFSRDCITVDRSLGRDDLGGGLDRIPLKGAREPTYLYPFSQQDKDYVVIPYVLRGLITHVFRSPEEQFKIDDPATLEEILKITHKHADRISAKHRKELATRVGKILKLLLQQNPDLQSQVSKLETTGHHVSTLQSLRKTCDELIARYETQTRLDTFSGNV